MHYANFVKEQLVLDRKRRAKEPFQDCSGLGWIARSFSGEEQTKSEPLAMQFRDHSGGLVSFLANSRQGHVEDKVAKTCYRPACLAP